jgi:hypothetical protein
MALVYNQITKQYEDDGTGLDASAPVGGTAPVVNAPIASNTTAVGDGGAGVTVNNITPPAPSWKNSQGGQRPTKAPGEDAAEAAIDAAGTKVLGAMDAVKGVEAEIATAEAAKPGIEASHLEQEKKRKEAEEADFQAKLNVRDAEEKAGVDKAAQSKIAAGQARVNYWKGNAVGEFIAAIVRSVAAGQMAREGKDGVSPAERIINDKMAAYEQSLVAKAEADAEMRDLKIKDRPRWEAAMAHIRKVAAEHNEIGLKIALANADKQIKLLEPRKRAAAEDLKKAVEERQMAEAEFKRKEGLRGVSRWEKEQSEKVVMSSQDGGKPTEGTRKSAAQGGVIQGALKDALTGPVMSKDGLKKMARNKAFARWGEKAPPLDAWIGLTPESGDMTGLSESDRMALRNTSQLAGTVTYLTTGAAQTDGEAQGRLAEVRLTADMTPRERAQVAKIVLRYVDQAKTQGSPNWTPQHQATYEELKGIVAGLEGSGAPKVRKPAGGAPASPPPAPAQPARVAPPDISKIPTAALKAAYKAAQEAGDGKATAEMWRELNRRGAFQRSGAAPSAP